MMSDLGFQVFVTFGLIPAAVLIVIACGAAYFSGYLQGMEDQREIHEKRKHKP